MLPVKPLDDELSQKKLDLGLFGVLCKLPREEHLADAFDCDLSKDSILYDHIVLNDDAVELQSGLGINAMDNKGVY